MRLALALMVMVVACDAQTSEGAVSTSPTANDGDKEYQVDIVGPAAAGPAASCTVTVTPKAPWVLKAETPFVAQLRSNAGLKIERARLDGKDFVDPQASAKSVRTGCVADRAGEHELKTDLSFFLCSAQICKRLTDAVTTRIRVQ